MTVLRDTPTSDLVTPAPTGSRGLLRGVQSLRALAVMAVLLYHFFPNQLTGGYVGVDVFFVISGFLMTKTLIGDFGSATSSRGYFGHFYARRIRRILPAAAFVLLVTAVLLIVFGTQVSQYRYLNQVAASAGFVENWTLIAQSTDYLAAGASPSPVLHYWSLSLEEQFYLLWPVLLFIALRFAARREGRERALWIVILTASVLSLAYSIYATSANAQVSYFHTGTRIWEFGLGAMTWLVLQRSRARLAQLSGVLTAALAVVGLVLIMFSVFTFDADTPVPGWIIVVPCLGACLFILAPLDAVSWPLKFLVCRPIQLLGDISYSVYLLHWPVLVLLGQFAYGGQTPPGRIRALLVPLVLVAAFFLKRLVEDPPRRFSMAGRGTPRWLIGGIVCAQVAVVLLALIPWLSVREDVQHAQTRLTAFTKAPPSCFGALETKGGTPCANPYRGPLVPSPLVAVDDFPYADCQQGFTLTKVITCDLGDDAKGAARMAVVGDSHMTQWLPAIDAWAKQRHYRVRTYLKSACSAYLKAPVPSCAQWNRSVADEVKSYAPAVLMFSAESADSVASVRPAADNLDEGVRRLTAGVPKVIGLVDTPQPAAAGIGNVVDCLLSSTRSECAFDKVAATSRDVVRPASVAGRKPFTVLDFTSAFCGARTCRPVIGGVLVYLDGTHMTATFARSLTVQFARNLDSAIS